MLFAANSPLDATPCCYKVIKKFTSPTNDTSQILKVISENMHYLYKSGVAYYRVGVGLLDLSSETHKQGDLFNPSKDNVQLMGVMDSINQRYGSSCLLFGAQGVNKPWSMRRELLTPQYTTNWRRLPKFTC